MTNEIDASCGDAYAPAYDVCALPDACSACARLVLTTPESYLRGKEFGFGWAFLAGRTDFHRFPELDAAVLQDGDRYQLVLNPYSFRLEGVRSSRLFRSFDEGGAVVDVDRLKLDGHHFAMRSDLDRSDEAAVLEELARQNPGCRFTFSAMQSFTGITTIPRDNAD
jgi:hypothetical protein